MVLENRSLEEINEVIDFCKSVGLPTNLEQLGIADISKEKLFEVAKELITSAEKRGDWKTSKNEYVVMYVMNKETIKTTSAKYFRERLSAVIQKLNDYSDTFDKTQTVN